MDITKGQIKKLHSGLKGCKEAQDAIKDAFPDCFEVEWKEITHEIEWRADGGGFINLWGDYKGDTVVYFGSNGLFPNSADSVDENIRIGNSGGCTIKGTSFKVFIKKTTED